MKEAGIAGSIVNVSSVKSLSAFRDSLAYNMSKASLDTISRQFALELGPHNIRVNSVNPTLVTTPLGMRAWTNPPKNLERLMFHTPLGRPAEMEDVVQPILYLLSDCSRMVTGSVHRVDGGLLSNVPV
ncbi:L-xylulose reductase-like [Mya arenaria]|nr:L-xylulose reductase-like [Mya arenaria]